MAEFFGFMGLYIPFFYIEIYALEKTDIDRDLAFYLLTLLNTGSFFGRIVSKLSSSDHCQSADKDYQATQFHCRQNRTNECSHSVRPGDRSARIRLD